MKPETRNSKPILYLIDGSNYVYRAFYAIKTLSNSKGFPTNAVYGFTNMLMKLMRDRSPEYMAVVFDSKGPTFRSEVYSLYKAHRPGMPEALAVQIPHIKELIRAFSIPIFEKEGLEADDIIGAIASGLASRGIGSVIVTGDKDLMQLVSEKIIMVDTMKDKEYDREGVKARFGVGPDSVADILGLIGDVSDNIPGVPGIGEKTAIGLIQEFGSIEGIYANLDKITKPKVREALKNHADQARMSRDLVVLRTDLDIDFNLEDTRLREPDRTILRDIFREFEFSSLIQELNLRREEALRKEFRIVWSKEELAAVLEAAKKKKSFAFCLELDSETAMAAEIAGISLDLGEGGASYVPVGHERSAYPGQLDAGYVLAGLKPLFEDPETVKHAFDLKTARIVLSRSGIELRGTGCDVMVASYVLNPSRRSHDLAEVARDYLNTDLPPVKEILGSGARKSVYGAVSPEKVLNYSCSRADAVCRLAEQLTERIKKEGFEDLFYGIELPLIEVLAAMEMRGVLVDRDMLERMSGEFDRILSQSEEKIYAMAGERFKINSPKQLQYILFEKLKLARGRKTKNGYSTDVEVLTALALKYELPAEILGYRSISKLKSTYIDALPLMINPGTGRIHTSYNQAVTATGRLSSSNPNLQNIPIRGMEGRRIRQAFIAPPGSVLVSADYSQIELRILAHLSRDPALIEIFRSGEDIHARTASEIFRVLPGTVTPDMRRQAKVINFGILYGMSPFGLSKELGISQTLAKEYIEKYFEEFRGVREYMDTLLEKARRDGFVATLFNRRRYLPEIRSANAPVRSFAERTAINTPIQGTAADLIKVAMIRIAAGLQARGMRTGMIMQVHDELVFETPMEERDEAVVLVREGMEKVLELEVPLKVEIAEGANWDEAH